MVYDCFTFFNELDILKIRLNELNDYIDKFVLVEATLTFSGKPKPLVFDQNKHLFKKFLPKIIHVIVDDLSKAPSIQNTKFYTQHRFVQKNPKTWAREIFQRNCINRGLIQAQESDTVLISDVDEIPNPNIIKKLPKNISSIIAFEQNSYYYYLNCLSHEKIIGTKAVSIKILDRNNPQDIRLNQNQRIIPDAGWHFTYLGQAQKIINKINSYSHQELNTAEVNNVKRIHLYINNNIDIFGRNIIIKTIPIDKSFPIYIQKNKKQYNQLIKETKKTTPNTKLFINEITKLMQEKENLQQKNENLQQKNKNLKQKHHASQVLLKKHIMQTKDITSSKWFKLSQLYHKPKEIIPKSIHLLTNLSIILLYILFIPLFFSLNFLIQKITQLTAKPLLLTPSQQKLDGVSFIIPTWNKKEMVIKCVNNLINRLKQESKKIKTEIIIIDNGSIDQTSNEIKKIKPTKNISIKLISLSQNLGFAKAINLGTQKAKYNYLYLLNNDMFPHHGFFNNLIDTANKLINNKQKFFAISSQIFFSDPNKRRQESGKTYTRFVLGFLYVAHLVKNENLIDPSFTSYAGGGSSLINKHLFLKLGGYDHQSYAPLYCEDLDCSFNAWRLGYPSIFIPNSSITHHHQSSTKKLKKSPNYYMEKNFLAFILKNISSPKLILQHLLVYPALMALKQKYIEYAFFNLKNIIPIFKSRQKLNSYKIKYTDKQLINFLNFETKLNAKF